MGGPFEARETPPLVVDPLAPALRPFRDQFVRAISGIMANPQIGVTPLEEGTIRGIFQQAEPARALLDQQVRGQFLPGQSQGNPFLTALEAGFERNANVARQRLASAAQRAGALTSTSYLDRARDLEGDLFERRSGLLSNLYEAERNRQMQSIPALSGLGRALLGAAQHPREVAAGDLSRTLSYGFNLLSGGHGSVIPGRREPSPFASFLSGLAPFAGLFTRF